MGSCHGLSQQPWLPLRQHGFGRIVVPGLWPIRLCYAARCIPFEPLAGNPSPRQTHSWCGKSWTSFCRNAQEQPVTKSCGDPSSAPARSLAPPAAFSGWFLPICFPRKSWIYQRCKNWSEIELIHLILFKTFSTRALPLNKGKLEEATWRGFSRVRHLLVTSGRQKPDLLEPWLH